MFRTNLRSGIALGAMILSGAAMAAPHGGGGVGAGIGASVHAGGPSPTAIDARSSSMGTVHAAPTGVVHSNANSALHTQVGTTPRVNPGAATSQGLQHASPTGIARANARSVLAAGAVPSASLPGLTTGLAVQTSAGTSLGTVTKVVTGTDGSIRMVVVTSADGKVYRLPGTSLSISGGLVTTTYGG